MKFDEQTIRHMNLFLSVIGVGAKHCFFYDNAIVFVIKPEFLFFARGNVEKLGRIIKRKIRIIASPKSNEKEEIEKFIRELAYPIEIKNISLNEELCIRAGMNKAFLIGRGRKKEQELQNILKEYFGIKKLRIAE